MRTPRLSLVTSPASSVPLRFDDPEFLQALEEDGKDPDTLNEKGIGRLAALLEVKNALDYDWSPFIEDGYVIHARTAITGSEEDAVFTSAQRPGGGGDLAAVHENWWSTWVKGVSMEGWGADDIPQDQARAMANLSSPNRKTRGDAFGNLPTVVRNGFRVRLRVHIDAASRPADRDPAKVAAPNLAARPLHGTGSSSSGDHAQSSAVGQ